MGKVSEHAHPNPQQYRAEQLITATLCGLIILGAFGLLLISWLLQLGAFALMAVLLCSLAFPLAMRLVVTAPVTTTDDGLIVQPLLLPEMVLPWSEVREVRAYPLLPNENQEVLRRLLLGRQRYTAAKGIMLVATGLSPLHRVAGWFAGAQGAPVLALTNRTHQSYDRLAQRVQTQCSAVWFPAAQTSAESA